MIRKLAALAIFGALAVPAMAQPAIQVTAPLPGGGVISVGNTGYYQDNYYAPNYVTPVYTQPYYYGGYYHRGYRPAYHWNGYRGGGYRSAGYSHNYHHR